MAQRVEILLVDDLDGSEASDTVTFSLDGVEYELDLSDRNADALRDALKPYVASARRAPSGSARRRRGGRASTGASRSASRTNEVRAWARSNGYEVSDRGRVPVHIQEAYDSAR